MRVENAADNVFDVHGAELSAYRQGSGQMRRVPPWHFDEGGIWLQADANRPPGVWGCMNVCALEPLWGRGGGEALGPNQ